MHGDELRRFQAAGFNHRSMLDENAQRDENESVYLPGDFRYFSSTHFQDNGEEVHQPREVEGGSSPQRIYASPDGVPDCFHTGRESLSVIRNVTIRDSKRPKARVQDHECHRRSSISPSALMTVQMDRSFVRPTDDGGFLYDTNGRNGVKITELPAVSPGMHRPQHMTMGGGITPTSVSRLYQIGDQFSDPTDFGIILSYEGESRHHHVTQHMFVSQLVEDAARIFQLPAGDLLLFLFGMVPRILSRQNRLSDSPRVGAGSTVLVCRISPVSQSPGGVSKPHSIFESKPHR
jgi:hypothetical protein